MIKRVSIIASHKGGIMHIKELLMGAAALLGLSACSSTPEIPSAHESPTPTPDEKQQTPVLTDSFASKGKESKNTDIAAKYQRAFSLVQAAHDRISELSMFCWRSGDWYILGVKLKPLPADSRATDDGDASSQTRATYVVDMRREKVIHKGDFESLAPVFETLKTRKSLPKDEETAYLCHIATLITAAATSAGNFIEPVSGQRFPEEVSFPTYDLQANTLVFRWFEASKGMTSHIIKHTVSWDGKNATHQETPLDMNGPSKTW